MKTDAGWWLIAGPSENWETAFKEGNIWGLRAVKNLVSNWQKLSQGDHLLFYSTKPVSGVIGYGIARTKFKQDKPLWPQEIKERKVIWPFRFEFDIEYCLPRDKWAAEKAVNSYIMAAAKGAFEHIKTEMAEAVVKQLPSRRLEPMIEKGKPLSLHDDLKAKLVQIGQLQNLIAESEYPMDGANLDVVWRRVEKAVPAYVFEVQIGGDLYHALGKLKHAYDIWNSNLILIARSEDLPKISQLLAGTFHEVNDKIKTIEPSKIDELFRLKRAYRDLESQIGIL